MRQKLKSPANSMFTGIPRFFGNIKFYNISLSVGSTDFEDIVYVLENRRSIWDDMKNADKEASEYLIEEFSSILKIHSSLNG